MEKIKKEKLLVMTCQICNKESGEYSLCPECFELIQKGEVKQCANCKGWYKANSICNCIKIKNEEKEALSDLKTNQPQKEADKKENSKSSDLKTLLFVILLPLLVIAIPPMIFTPFMSIHNRLEAQGDTGEKTNFFVSLFKDAPSVNADYDIDFSTDGERICLGFDVIVDCNANYNEVVAKIEFRDRSDAIFKTSYITFEDCKEGNVYRKKYNLSAEEILLTDTVRCTLYKYT